MSTIVNVESSGSLSEYKVLVKGAPEIVRDLLKTVPSDFDRLYLEHVKNGARVLALAWKSLKKEEAEG